MKQHISFILIIFIICGVTNSTPAHDIPSKKPSTILFALTSSAKNENLTELLTNQITENLNNEGYQVVFDESSSYPSPFDITLDMDLKTTANLNLYVDDHVQIFPYTAPIKDISSILETSYLKGSYIAIDDANDKTGIARSINVTTALALYSVGDCDHMNPYLDSVINSLENMDSFDERGLVKSLYFYKGNCSILQGNYALAANQLGEGFIYEGADSLDYGKLVGSVVNFAWVDIQLGKQQEAIDVMTRMVNDIESFGQGYAAMIMWMKRYIQRAEIYNLVGHYDDAVKDLTAVIEMTTGGYIVKSHAYLMRGQTYLLLYEWDKVAADYNKALELDPTYAEAYFYRGVLYYSILQTGQAMYADALADFQRYLELAPDGEHAADATRYATDIQTQINALNN